MLSLLKQAAIELYFSTETIADGVVVDYHTEVFLSFLYTMPLMYKSLMMFSSTTPPLTKT